MKQKQGQLLMSGIIVAIMVFIAGVLLMNFLFGEIDGARSSDSLNCANETVIRDGEKLTCLAVDVVIPYFIISFVSGAAGFVTSHFAGGSE